MVHVKERILFVAEKRSLAALIIANGVELNVYDGFVIKLLPLDHAAIAIHPQEPALLEESSSGGDHALREALDDLLSFRLLVKLKLHRLLFLFLLLLLRLAILLLVHVKLESGPFSLTVLWMRLLDLHWLFFLYFPDIGIEFAIILDPIELTTEGNGSPQTHFFHFEQLDLPGDVPNADFSQRTGS